MNIWDILGIDETTNVSAIKKAFAAKSKIYHPEEYPEEFKNLRKAYKEALKYAKNNAGNNNFGREKPKTEGAESKYVSFDFAEEAKKDSTDKQNSQKEISKEYAGKLKIHTDSTEIPKVEEKPKSLYERLHGEKPKTSNEEAMSSKKPKSLFERLHGETPKVVHEKTYMEETTLFERMPQEDSKKTENDEQDYNEFNFDQIYNDRAVEKFLDELRIIFNNPFLRNNITFWDIYMNNNWNGDLLKNRFAIEKLLYEMCKYQGWFEVTLKKLEEKLKLSLDKVRENKVKIQSMATEYERGYDNFIMKQVEQNGFAKSLDNEDSIRCYLAIYFDMVRKKKIIFRDEEK